MIIGSVRPMVASSGDHAQGPRSQSQVPGSIGAAFGQPASVRRVTFTRHWDGVSWTTVNRYPSASVAITPGMISTDFVVKIIVVVSTNERGALDEMIIEPRLAGSLRSGDGPVGTRTHRRI